MINWANFVSQVFNGLALGALLALISSGLTIIYGTLGVLNLAHGAMFMIGGYAGYVAFSYTGSFIAAVIAGSLFVGIVGIVMERVIIRHFYGRPHEDQLLVTFGLGIVFVELVRFAFGSQSQLVPPPPLFAGITSLGFMFYPTYRLAVVGIIAIALSALFIVLYRTRIGMIVRAGIEDSGMVDALGINIYRVFMLAGAGARIRTRPSRGWKQTCTGSGRCRVCVPQMILPSARSALIKSTSVALTPPLLAEGDAWARMRACTALDGGACSSTSFLNPSSRRSRELSSWSVAALVLPSSPTKRRCSKPPTPWASS